MITEENRDTIQKQYPAVKRCPVCQSHLIGWRECRWHHDEHGRRTTHTIGLKVICPYCQRLTVEDPLVPDNDNAPLPVTPNHDGWVRCPHCRGLFTLRDPAAYSGERHRKCGQRLIPQPE